MRALFAPLLLLGFLWMARWWILAAFAIAVLSAALWWLSNRMADRDDVERAQRAELAARADVQHAQVLAGDDRGVYGEYRPAQGFTGQP